MNCARLLFLTSLLLLSSISIAQDAGDVPEVHFEDSTDKKEVYNPPPSTNDINGYTGPTKVQRTSFEQQMSIFILIFAILVLFMEFLLIFYNKLGNEQGIKIFAVTIIITSGLFLITAGYSNDQIAPVIGLLGTIAGYLLGNLSPTKTSK